MALTTLQLLYINNLLYSDNPPIYSYKSLPSEKPRTLGEMVANIQPEKNAGFVTSVEEWSLIKNQIMQDEQLMNLEIIDTYVDNTTGDKRCVLRDPSTNEAIVAFKGTGSGEWKDDFIAGSTMDNGLADNTISVQQQKALDYMDDLNLDQYDSVTVTGHSKGGNKAKICALLRDDVDRCVSFDGQGFSDEFVEAHKDDIARNQYKIHNNNLDGDYVNILLNDVGETTYYEGQRIGINVLKNHAPNAFLTDSGDIVVGEQSKFTREMDKLLHSMIRSVDPQKKKDLLDCWGEIADAIFREDSIAAKAKNTVKVLFDPRYADEIAYTLAYAAKYSINNIENPVSAMFRQLGMTDFANAIDSLTRTLSNGFLSFIVGLGAWQINMVSALIKKIFGIDSLPYDFVVKLLTAFGSAFGSIKIEKNTGEDIRIENAAAPSQADVIAVSIDLVESCAHQLQSLREKVGNAEHTLAAVSTDMRAGGDLKVQSSVQLSGGMRIAGTSVAAQIVAYRKALNTLEDDMARLSEHILQVAEMFENTENSLRAGVSA